MKDQKKDFILGKLEMLSKSSWWPRSAL